MFSFSFADATLHSASFSADIGIFNDHFSHRTKYAPCSFFISAYISSNMLFSDAPDDMLVWAAAANALFWGVTTEVVFRGTTTEVLFWGATTEVLFWTATTEVLSWGATGDKSEQQQRKGDVEKIHTSRALQRSLLLWLLRTSCSSLLRVAWDFTFVRCRHDVGRTGAVKAG